MIASRLKGVEEGIIEYTNFKCHMFLGALFILKFVSYSLGQ
jgi:hypothetical protein